MIIRIVQVLLMTFLAGCLSAVMPDRISYFEMSQRLEYQGFSFERPPNPGWYIMKKEETLTDVLLRRDLSTSSPTHSFYASVSLGGIERQPTTPEEFAELARSKGQNAPYEIRTVDYEQILTTRQNQWCIRVESSHVVVGAPVAPDRELTLIVRGYRCLHPTWPKTTLDFFYSERGLPDEIKPNLWEEGEAFLDGVRIDIAPRTPAA